VRPAPKSPKPGREFQVAKYRALSMNKVLFSAGLLALAAATQPAAAADLPTARRCSRPRRWSKYGAGFYVGVNAG
jgi:hypothetical protein